MNSFFFRDESPISIAIFRILFGLILLLNAFLLWPDLLVWYGANGLIPVEMAHRLLDGPAWSLLFIENQSNDTLVLGLFFTLVLACLALTLGFFTRLSSIVVFVLIVSFHHRNTAILHSGDTLIRLISFLLIFSPAGRALSLDSFLAKKDSQSTKKMVSPWAFRLIQLQISLLYVTTALYKLQGSTWRDGTALYYIFRMADFHRFPLPKILNSLPLLRVLSWGTIAIELALGTLIWVKPLRYPILVMGIGFHLGIEYSMNIPVFQLLMIACLLSFVRPESWNKLIDRLICSPSPSSHPNQQPEPLFEKIRNVL